VPYPQEGPAYWLSQPFRHPIAFGRHGAHVISAPDHPSEMSFQRSNGAANRIPTLAGTTNIQLVNRGGQMPMNLSEESGSVAFTIRDADNYAILEAAFSRGFPWQFYGRGKPRMDTWFVAFANSGQTTWITSRPMAYNSATPDPTPGKVVLFDSGGVIRARAWGELADGTWEALTIVDTTPADHTKVQLPEVASGNPYDTVTTHADLLDEYVALHVEYFPRPYVTIESMSEHPRGHNHLEVALSLQEVAWWSGNLQAVS
jgi:hypothetical protein